jgi:lipoyl(octanoyl) transferase
MNFEVLDLGKVDYLEAWERQKELLTLRIEDKIPDTLIFCEHPAVVTLGRASQRDGEVLPPLPFPVVEVERGGHATYHGPGQIVMYPIVKLGPARNSQFPQGLKYFVCSMEKVVIAVLEDLGIPSLRVEGSTGVWVAGGERKIASIGVAVKHWVTYHGLALNYATGLDPWRYINPCGFSAEVMTDIQKERGSSPSFDELKDRIVSNWAQFRCDV